MNDDKSYKLAWENLEICKLFAIFSVGYHIHIIYPERGDYYSKNLSILNISWFKHGLRY